MIYGDEEDWSDAPPRETGWYWASRALGQVMPVEICLGELRKINDSSFEAPLMWRAATSPALHQLDTLIKWWGPRIGRTPPLPEHIRVVVALNRENKLNGELAALDMKTDGARTGRFSSEDNFLRSNSPVTAQSKAAVYDQFVRALQARGVDDTLIPDFQTFMTTVGTGEVRDALFPDPKLPGLAGVVQEKLEKMRQDARIAAAHVGQATRQPDPIWAEQEKTERRSEFIRRLTSGK